MAIWFTVKTNLALPFHGLISTYVQKASAPVLEVLVIKSILPEILI